MDLRNRRDRLNNLYRVQDDDGNECTFKMRPAQKVLYDTERGCKKKNGRTRIVFLKARQVGGTTYKIISLLDKCLFVPNTNARIVAHNMDKLQDIFKKVKFAYERIPNMIDLGNGKVRKKPVPKYDTKSEYYFAELGSHIKIALDARSGTVTDLHISELAFIDNAEEMMAGTMPAAKNADVTIETTANGMNFFYKFWKKQENKKNPTFTPLFLPWYIEKSYVHHLDDEYRVPDDLKYMLERYNLTPEQMYRYIKKREDDPRLVRQEFPSEPEEAFVATGDNVFPLLLIKSLPTLPYTIDAKYPQLRRYREPTGREMMGVDTSLGGENGDFSSITVRDLEGRLVCQYYDRCPPEYLAEVIDYLFTVKGVFGWIGIESNNTGIATIEAAKKYWWFEYVYCEKTVDKKTNQPTKKVGRNTNSKTRPLMLNEYEEAIRKGYIDEVDEREKTEMYGFIYNEKKRPEAIKGSHDDAIISGAICRQMRKEG